VTAAALANGSLTLLIRPAVGPARRADRGRALGWLGIYGAAFALAVLPLFLIYRLTFLLVFGMGASCFLLIRAFLLRGREDRSLPGELLGTAGLCMVGPAAHAVAAQAVEPIGALLWFLLFLFFASGVFYVRMRIRGVLSRRHVGAPESEPALWSCVAYHLILLAGLPLLAAWQVVPWAILLAFAPALWRAAVGCRRRHEPLEVKRLGWSEVAQTAVFLLLVVAVFRFPTFLG
jgi:hypothetical protein